MQCFKKKIFLKSYQAMKRHGGNRGILLSKRSQSEKATHCMIPTILGSRKGKTMETIKRSVLDRS